MSDAAPPAGGADRRMMRRAVELAAATHPHPNPRVGAVVVDAGGRVVAEAAHTGPGRAHAEAAALDAAGEAAAGAKLYTTLEPCNHHGRTPPCVPAIVASGVATVIVGALDPDSRVSGAGVGALRAAGVEVEVGVEAGFVESADPAYFHHRRTGRPLVTWKMALTLDGQAAAADGSSQWITGPRARNDAHGLRAASDAVAVGAGTAQADDPQLTVRLEGYSGPQPRPVLVLGRRPVSPRLALWERHPLVYAPTACEIPAGDLVVAPEGDGEVDLAGMVHDLGHRGLLALLVEGGPTLAASLLGEGLIDRAVIYYGSLVAGGSGTPALPGFFGSLADARKVEIRSTEVVGDDIRVEVRF